MIRKLIAKIFGKNVALRDIDGEVSFRRAYQLGGIWYADRFGFGIRTCVLLPDGTVDGGSYGSYVRNWTAA